MKQSRKANQTNKLWAVLGILVLIVAGVWFFRYSYQLYQEKKATEARGQFEYPIELIKDGGILEYKDKKYRRNPNVKAILFIGVDTSGELDEKVSGRGGQADSLLVAAYDVTTDKVRLLMIPRDTMTPITLTDLSGNVLGKDMQHLTLAYAYGDGRELSCERTKEAVSELLFGLPIDGYLAMNTSMISELNDLAGGVTVTIQAEGMEKRDPAMVKGAQITLSGKQAEVFTRYRDVDVDNSAMSRMSNQKQYMQAYFETIKRNAAKDSQLIPGIMNFIETKMITDMPKDQYMSIGMAVLNSSHGLGAEDMMTIPGEAVTTVLFDEFHHDPDGTAKLVLDLFYQEQ